MIYEQDGDVSEFVDTCVRAQQIEELASKHANAFAPHLGLQLRIIFAPSKTDVTGTSWTHG